MDRLQTPPRPLSQMQPAPGEPSGQAPTTGPVQGTSPRLAWGSGAEAGAQGGTVSKSREPGAGRREPGRVMPRLTRAWPHCPPKAFIPRAALPLLPQPAAPQRPCSFSSPPPRRPPPRSGRSRLPGRRWRRMSPAGRRHGRWRRQSRSPKRSASTRSRPSTSPSRGRRPWGNDRRLEPSCLITPPERKKER